MWNEFVKSVTNNPQFAVVVALLLIALILGSVALLWSYWVAPKLAEVAALQQTVGRLDGTIGQVVAAKPTEAIGRVESTLAGALANLKVIQDGKYGEAIGSLSAKIGALESAREAERKLQDEQNKASHETVSRLIEEIKQLQTRSEREILRMLTENKYVLAIEQAGQDVDLAEIGEQLARLNPALHPAAIERLATAKTRLEELKKRRDELQ